MSRENIRMAWMALGASRWRSLLTMLGMSVGVLGVVTTVSIGEGLRRQVLGQVGSSTSNVLTVKAGVPLAKGNALQSIGAFNNVSLASLNEVDLQTIAATQGVAQAVPLSVVSGGAKADNKNFDEATVIATNQGLPSVISQQLSAGSFFLDNDDNQDTAVIGRDVAERLFQEAAPTGKTLQLRGRSFIVRGVLEDFATNPITTSLDFNTAIFIHYPQGKLLNNGQAPIQQILIKPTDTFDSEALKKSLDEKLQALHGGQRDFTILDQRDNVAATNRLVALMTIFITALTAISLLVGGIGIMNIMLTTVSERTHEIGLRKSVGATNHQILAQFIIEATVLSVSGGIIGIILALVTSYFLRLFTDLTPVVTWPIMAMALGSVLAVGLFFGAAPALKAARKDPIQALRHH